MRAAEEQAMVQLKAFALLVVIAFTVDLAACDGSYRRELGRDIHVAADRVSSLDWNFGWW
jgi:hypothetical protein